MYLFTAKEVVQPSQPLQILRYFCRICGKGYRGMAALRHHERDAHGPRMRRSQCNFTCPERRHFEMKRHKEIKHGISSTIPPHKMQMRRFILQVSEFHLLLLQWTATVFHPIPLFQL